MHFTSKLLQVLRIWALPLALLSSSTLSFAQNGKDGDIEITEEARAHFRAGVSLLQDPEGARFEEAYRQFIAAYEKSPSWKILSNLAIAAMQLERDGEAADALEEYLRKGGDQIPEDERAQFERDLQTLKVSIVKVKLNVSPASTILMDERSTNRGELILNEYLVPESGELLLRIRPGRHKITARLSDHVTQVWEFNASAATSHEHDFQLEKATAKGAAVEAKKPKAAEAAPTHRPIPTSVWASLGVTGALTAGATVTGIVALGKGKEYDEAIADGGTDADALRDQVKTLNLVTDILIGSAIAGAALTTVLYLLRPEVPVEGALRVEPLVGPNSGALLVSGTF